MVANIYFFLENEMNNFLKIEKIFFFEKKMNKNKKHKNKIIIYLYEF